MAYQFSTSGMLSPQVVRVSDDGSLALVLEQDGRLDLVSNGGAPLVVSLVSPNSGIAFLPGQSTAVLVDGGAGTISLLANLDGAPQVRQIAGSLPGSTASPLVQTSQDGRFVFWVFARATTAYRIDLTTGQTQTIGLRSAATRLDRLGAGDDFVLSAEPGNSAWFLIGTAANLEIVFSPISAHPGLPSVSCGPGVRRGACR
jgi:hypothetical protein